MTALTFLVLQASFALIQFQSTMDHVAAEIHLQSIASLRTQETFQKSLVAVAQDVRDFRLESRDRLQDAVEILDARLQDTNRILAFTAGGTVGSMVRLNETLEVAAGSLSSVAAGARQIEDQISDALLPFLDCERNAACLYSRWAAGSKAFIDVLGTIDKAAPQIAASAIQNGENIEGITADVHEFTSKFTARRTLLGRFWEGLKLLVYGARLWLP
jgi:hypothetical protein